MANFEHGKDDPQNANKKTDIPTVGSSVMADQTSSALGGNNGDLSTIPSFAAACELLTAPYSCLVMKTHRRHIALAPLYLNKKKTGIKQELDAELLKFSQSLNGVPLAYDDIKIVGSYGHIYDDSGYIHMDIEANFIIFQPQTQQKLLGKVNKLGLTHVGCLVHNCFNASIPKPNMVSVETWRDAGPCIGAELEFEVTALDADIAGVLLIRGRLDRTRVQELLAVAESLEFSVPAEQPGETPAEATQEEAQEPPEEAPKKKKKKKKDKIKEEQVEYLLENSFLQQEMTGTADGDETVKKKKKKKAKIKEEPEEQEIFSDQLGMNGSMIETNDAEGVEKKKKKRKKDKLIKGEEEEVAISSLEIQGSDSSGYLSDKQIKKRKRENSINGEDLTPTKSKKKKQQIDQFA